MPRTKQFNEEEVLKKAMELFWEKGFHATSIQDLVSHLGINRASLYDTFGGKDILFDKAFAHYRKGATDWLNGIFESAETVKGGFQKLFDSAIQESVEDECRRGCFVVNTTTELVPGDKDLLKVLSENKSNLESLFLWQIQKGIDSGEFASSMDAKGVASMIFTFYNGLRVVAKVDPNPIELKKMVEAALSVLH